MRHLSLKLFMTFLCLTGYFAPTISAKNFSDIRVGYGTHTTQVSNTKHLYIAPNIDLNAEFRTGPYLTHFNISYWAADTNASHFINGILTNTRLSNRMFYARAWSLSLTEYIPLALIRNFEFMPGIDMKIAHYNDISAGTEFLSPSTDYMYMFLRLALRSEYTFNMFTAGFEFKYPLLAVLTDKIWKENRNENTIHLYGTFQYSSYYLRMGFERSSLTYSNRVTNGAGWPYRFRIQNALYIALGIEF